jgi:hypothetical protein
MQGKRAAFLIIMAIALARAVPVQALNVDIFSGFTTSGGGTPYSGLVGSFTFPDIQFGTNTGFSWHPFGLASFGADITGSIVVSAPGTYTFSLNSDDGSLLFIDGALAVDNGGPHGPQPVNGSTFLTAGPHNIEVQFFECCGGESGVDLNLPAGVTFGSVAPVGAPEPATWLLLTTGLTGILGYGWRRKK